MAETVYIGLGGNVGNVEASMAGALELLDSHLAINLLDKSGLYKTPPWGDDDQDWFLNACAKFEVGLSPQALLDELKRVERKFKRKKTRRWGPRTIDLDILLFGALQIKSGHLEIPHPRILERAFVLQPLIDIAPDLMIGNRRLADWLSELDTSGITRAKAAGEW